MHNPRQKLSGAQYKKLAKEKEKQNEQSGTSMRNWLKKSSDPPTTEKIGSTAQLEDEKLEISEIIDDPVENSQTDCSHTGFTADNTSRPPSSIPSTSSAVESLARKSSANAENSYAVEEKVPSVSIESSDPSTWPAADEMTDNTRTILTDTTVRLAEKYPNCVDFGSTEREKRHLTSSVWYKVLPNGEKVKRSWLLYSKTENALFCAPCKLFLNVSRTAGLSALQTTGMTNWRKIYEKLPQHESSSIHTECIIKWRTLSKTIKSCSGINKDIERAIEIEKQKCREILHVVIDAVMYLATNCLSFRGSEENQCALTSAGTKSRGNFLNLIALLAKHNSTLKNKLDDLRKGQVSYFSKTIQNEIIEVMAEKVRAEILSEIVAARYFTVMFDCTPDVSHREQMSQVIRYVKISGSGDCEIKERFIDFIEVHGKTGEYIAGQILNKLHADGLDINNCRGQSYDNGSNMAGVYKGVQSRIQEKNKLAVFVPCLAHSLNLVGVHASSACTEASHVFGIVQRIFCFFVSSTMRWEIMKKHTKSNLKGTSQTRWSAKAEAVAALTNNLAKVTQALEEIRDGSFPPETKSDAKSLLIAILDFRFILNLVIWDCVLKEINRVNTEIQKKDIILTRSICLMEGLRNTLQRLRTSGFEGWFEEATIIAGTMSVEAVLKQGRIAKRKRMADELAEDESRTLSSNQRFTQAINIIFDRILMELDARIKSSKILNEDFAFLNGRELMQISNSELRKYSADLALKYSEDLDAVEFSSEVEVFKDQAAVLCEKVQELNPLDLLRLIYGNDLQDAFPNLCTALRIYVTLPTTSATCERSFSKLKLIKNYLRSTISQERLTSLAILSIESEVANGINYDDVINTFAEKKSRRVKF